MLKTVDHKQLLESEPALELMLRVASLLERVTIAVLLDVSEMKLRILLGGGASFLGMYVSASKP